MSNRLTWIDEELAQLKDAGFFNRIRTISSPQGPSLTVDGKQVLNFCSNNYLGLANNPRVVKAAQEALGQFGAGPAAVRTIAGTTSLHLDLEKRLASFKGVPSAIIFQSGYCALVSKVFPLRSFFNPAIAPISPPSLLWLARRTRSFRMS